MGKHDIVVIGASAGGVEALQRVVSSFPPDLPAAVFVVLHISPRSRSLLPGILNDAGPLPVSHAEDGMPIKHGQIYVAPPDHHLILERGHVRLGLGPREQHQRPCINITFRSAALAYGERVIGVVLTGQLDDGTVGLWDIKQRGGMVVVQNPEGAAFPSMPLSALREIEADYTVPLAEIGPLLNNLVMKDGGSQTGMQEVARVEEKLKLTEFTCPDCCGTIWETKRGSTWEYRCRIGHTFSPRTMLAEHFAAQEKALWCAIVALEEGAVLANRLADNWPELSHELRGESREHHNQAETLRTLLNTRKTFSID